MTKYRPHCGLLDESMAGVIEVKTLDDLVQRMREPVERWYPPDKLPTVENTKVEPYGYDNRIGWDTHIVTVDGNAWGFTNGPIAKEIMTDDEPMTLAEALAIYTLIQMQNDVHDEAQRRALKKAMEIIADSANAAINQEWERRG